MPKDSSGVRHTGAQGLFDDVDEMAQIAQIAQIAQRAAAANTDAYEMHGVQSRARRDQWYAGDKEATVGRRMAWDSRVSRFFGKITGKKAEDDDEDGTKDLVANMVAMAGGIAAGVGGGSQQNHNRGGGGSVSYSIARGAHGHEHMCREGEVEALESPWLKECGMVRVKSSVPGGCQIVSKNMFQRDDGGGGW